MNNLKAFFLQQIEESTTSNELDYIIERASEEIENNEDYTEIYDKAFTKLQSWQPI